MGTVVVVVLSLLLVVGFMAGMVVGFSKGVQFLPLFGQKRRCGLVLFSGDV
jgi:hypothetical protein